MLKYALPILYTVRPAMVYEMLRKRLSDVIPFNGLLGVEVVSISDGAAEARVPFRPDLMNHIGTMHAGATFAVAEAASGAALSGAFAPIILKVRPVAANASVTYLKTAKTSLTARAKTDQDPADLRAQLDADGKTKFDVLVDVSDEDDNTIATLTVAWHVSMKR